MNPDGLGYRVILARRAVPSCLSGFASFIVITGCASARKMTVFAAVDGSAHLFHEHPCDALVFEGA